MLPVMKRLFWSVLVPALAGGLVAGGVCWCVFTVGERASEKAGGDFEKSDISHRPPVPVSSPLVLPSTSSLMPPIPIKIPKADIKLPSFSPLVRRVIPSVVNISISRGGGVQETISVENEENNLEKDASGDKKYPYNSVVHRTHKIKKRRFRHKMVKDAEDDLTGAGSGFIVDASGVIVTNRHVVGGATRVMVALSDGRSLPAKILGDDPMTDIAVIKVDSNTPLPCVTWGDSRQVEIGDWILVAGNPFGFGSSVTAGIISAVGRDLGIGALDDFMQLDAPINPGNSGGPAFNLDGQVVAVNAAIASPSDGSVGIGFGIPAEIVLPVVESIERTGRVEHGWLGVTLNDTSSPMWVEDVDSHGAAWLGGLRERDAILEMGGVSVHDARTVLRSVAAAHPGTVFVFTIRRKGQIKTLSITLGKRPITDM